MAHPNEDLVRKGYAAFSSGDMETLGSIMTPDVVHAVPGNNLTSGEHTGQEAVFAMYGQLFELSDGTVQVDLQDVTAEATGGDYQALVVTVEQLPVGPGLVVVAGEEGLGTVEGLVRDVHGVEQQRNGIANGFVVVHDEDGGSGITHGLTVAENRNRRRSLRCSGSAAHRHDRK